MTDWSAHIIGGFGGTVVLTTALSASRGLGFTRIDIPFMLGSMFTSDRDKAKWVGFFVHLINGWLFTLIYFEAFMLHPNWSHYWLHGLGIGLVHALFILTVGMALLPSFHPRMATEARGPDPTRLLEPPGFMALHYGYGTPVVTIIAHLMYGSILGICFG
jgi:hypothetical protein